MFESLRQFINGLEKEQIHLSEERRLILREIGEYVVEEEHAKLIFICTHNSRRSHLSQIWAQTLAKYFGVAVETYSGGTEETAFHPNAVESLRRAGFDITKQQGDLANPIYEVKSGLEETPIVAFSKKFEDTANPKTGFAAIMTCSEADSDCPVVAGAAQRIQLFYEDPKIADGSPDEQTVYDARCRQIASEMFYIFRYLPLSK
ncbi:MAG: protein-tyrosine-phosphatase [Bacteroidota bacterium]